MKYRTYFLKDVLEASSQKKFTFISTFAGGGGSSTGYRLAGGDCLLFNEFVEEAVKTYLTNYPSTPVLCDDIKKYSGQDFLDMIGLKTGELDILDGSPPCSAFSSCGKGPKGWNKEKKYSDGKRVENIENLFLEFIRIAKVIQPKIIIAENVKGLMQKGNDKKLNEFTNTFQRIGYGVTFKLLNSKNHGVPQSRQRIIIIAIRDDICDALDIYPMTMDSLYPDENHDFVSMQEAFENLQQDEEQRNMLLEYVQKTPSQKKWVELLPFFPEKMISPDNEIFRDINPNGAYFNMKRPSANFPCPTLTQRGQQRSVSGVLHYGEHRKLTIPEMKRIMSLPDDYILTGEFDKQAERIGRMVPPKMMQAIAESIYEKILLKLKE